MIRLYSIIIYYNNMWMILIKCILVCITNFLYHFTSLFGASLWNNFSIFDVCLKHNLFELDFKNKELIHISCPQVILFFSFFSWCVKAFTFTVIYYQWIIYLRRDEHQWIHLKKWQNQIILKLIYRYLKQVLLFLAVINLFLDENVVQYIRI